ncbi:MAG: N-acetyltransferase [Calditrichales bacterium]|nr:MAG: N-acetyltransferase [Calditrichales bacterium]
MMNNPFLIGNKIYLRAPGEGDETIIAISENHPAPRETLFYARPSSAADIRKKLNDMAANPNTIALVICNLETDEVLGLTSFLRIDWIGRMAIFYIAISEEKNWSQGYGSEATHLMMAYAFNTLNFNRVQLHVYAGNEKAVKAYQRCGFIIEGTLRQAMYRDGSYHDFFVMGLLREDWIKTTPQ